MMYHARSLDQVDGHPAFWVRAHQSKLLSRKFDDHICSGSGDMF